MLSTRKITPDQKRTKKLHWLALIFVLFQSALSFLACRPREVARDIGKDNGDGGPAVNAKIFSLLGVAVDAGGNIFITDGNDWKIRRVDAYTRTISTVAGNGRGTFNGDNVLATATSLGGLGGISLDSKGNLFIADSYNHCIRRVDAMTGLISTAVGNRRQGYSGDGGPAINASLDSPFDVAVDQKDNLYIADRGNNCIRRVDATSNIITTIAGDGSKGMFGGGGFGGDGGPSTKAKLNAPLGIALDATGNLFIADTNNNRIRQVNLATGIITTVAGDGYENLLGSLYDGGEGRFSGDGGPATSASLHRPTGISIDRGGNLLIVDSGNHCIRRVETATGIITTIVGNPHPGFSGDGGPARDAKLDHPFAIEIDGSGSLFIADSGNRRLRRVDSSGIITTVAGSGEYPYP